MTIAYPLCSPYSRKDPAGFYRWIIQLAQDAAARGCIGRFRRQEDLAMWLRVYTEGVYPSIAAVLAWATLDPERFADLRQTEEESGVFGKMAA